MSDSAYHPKIIGFLCHWCSYAGADRAGQSRLGLPAGFLPVRVMCTGRVSASHVLSALRSGADGVMVLGCHPKDCHYRSGNVRALALTDLTTGLLRGLGFHPDRLKLHWISSAEGEELVKVVTAFHQRLCELGPLPTPPAPAAAPPPAADTAAEEGTDVHT